MVNLWSTRASDFMSLVNFQKPMFHRGFLHFQTVMYKNLRKYVLYAERKGGFFLRFKSISRVPC